MTLKKPHLAACAALLCTAPLLCAAQSNVNLYGIFDINVRHQNNAGPGNAKLTNINDGLFGGSRLGFKGAEPVGGDVKAVFVLEMGFDPSTGNLQQSTAVGNYGQAASPTGRAFGRESWVGFTSDTFGSLTIGRQYTLAHQAAARIQPQGNPNVDAITVLSNHHMARQDNMVKYSKQFGPVALAASVTASEGLGRGSGLSAVYTSPRIDVVAYGQNLSAATGGEVRKIKGGGFAYAIAPEWKAFLAYMTRSQDISAQRNHVLSLGLNYNITPALVLTASLTDDRQNAFAATAAGTRKVVWFSADYFLSKRTDLYAEVDHNKVDGGYVLPAFLGAKGTQTAFTLGVRHRF